MLCGPLQNTPVAQWWAMAHGLKTTALDYGDSVTNLLQIESQESRNATNICVKAPFPNFFVNPQQLHVSRKVKSTQFI